MAQSQAGEGVNLAIIITPMLDMAFQLLAFFVMTYNPAAFEGQFEVRQTLPPEKEKKKLGSGGGGDPLKKDVDLKEVADDPVDPKKKSEAFVIAVEAAATDSVFIGANQKGDLVKSIRKEGEPTKISLKKPEAASEEIIANVEDAINRETGGGPFMAKLTAELKKIKEVSGSNTEINLKPEAQLKHEWVMYIMGRCRREGFTRINFVEPSKK